MSEAGTTAEVDVCSGDESRTAEPGAAQAKPESAWAIMRPVQGQIRLAVALSIVSSLATLGALGCLSVSLSVLLNAGSRSWPMGPLAGALVCTVVAYVLRSQAFNQSHYAAFRLETILRSELAAHLGKISLGDAQRVGAAALSKVIHDDVKASTSLSPTARLSTLAPTRCRS